MFLSRLSVPASACRDRECSVERIDLLPFVFPRIRLCSLGGDDSLLTCEKCLRTRRGAVAVLFLGSKEDDGVDRLDGRQGIGSGSAGGILKVVPSRPFSQSSFANRGTSSELRQTSHQECHHVLVPICQAGVSGVEHGREAGC